MPYRPRGPRDWAPGMKRGVVETRIPGREYRLRLVRELKTYDDAVRTYLDFWIAGEVFIDDKDLGEVYEIEQYQDGKKVGLVGRMLWYPSFGRGGVIFREMPKGERGTLEAFQKEDYYVSWSNAMNEIDLLERWLWDEMTG